MPVKFVSDDFMFQLTDEDFLRISIAKVAVLVLFCVRVSSKAGPYLPV